MTKDSRGTNVDERLYKSIIGSLLYLTASIPYIAFAVGICARYQSCPKNNHLGSTKRIIKYVNGTSGYGLLYTLNTSSSLVDYYDAYWVASSDDRKSTSGGCFFLGNNLISWFSKKQYCVFLSTTEAKYVVVGSSCTQLLWIRQMLMKYDVS
ncbi:secreted RxLR effector protein 161-like [Benincasa hispida]|uniref:secreted RxLR effector protein 161-like n=1 Tax=Benincasa hispida TaxID=102211 RepID=UPI0018FFE88E|nr:secreted RxLR effector protein 161-like [Benincasa hispida]